MKSVERSLKATNKKFHPWQGETFENIDFVTNPGQGILEVNDGLDQKLWQIQKYFLGFHVREEKFFSSHLICANSPEILNLIPTWFTKACHLITTLNYITPEKLKPHSASGF